MKQERACFDAGDVDRIVITLPRAEIFREIRRAEGVLLGELSEPICFYWKDRLNAYKLALMISNWYGDLRIQSETSRLETENLYLKQQLRTPKPQEKTKYKDVTA